MEIVKIEEYRSKPGVNTAYDRERIIICCDKREAMKIKKMVRESTKSFPAVRNENIADISSDWQIAERFAYGNPNAESKEWSKIFTALDLINESVKEDRHRLERWVNGSPGVDKGYILVNRFIQIIANKPQPFISIRLRGNMELTEDKANQIRNQFLGRYVLNG